MRFAVIAAGEGSRLAAEGVGVPKPLVRLEHETLVERLLRIFAEVGGREVVMIVNPQMKDVVAQTGGWQRQMESRGGKLTVVVKETPSSLHSLNEMAPWLEGKDFCLTTVDTIFRESDFLRCIKVFREGAMDGLMGVTDYIDDEKPLYVKTDETGRIEGFYDTGEDCRLVSGGIYCLRGKTLEIARRCVEEGQNRMRNFQRRLVEEGLDLQTYTFGKILDVDHQTDIDKARRFVKKKTFLGVTRMPVYSPHSNDILIMERVKDVLDARGHRCKLVTEETLEEGDEVDACFSMARSERALDILERMAERGCNVVNAPKGVRIANYRKVLAERMKAEKILAPETRAFCLTGNTFVPTRYPGWIKRSKGCSEVEGDVNHVACREEYDEACRQMENRGLNEAIWMEHLEGDLVKFYGIAHTGFLRCTYPTLTDKPTKFGWEHHNGTPMQYPFSERKLKETADRLALAIGVPIYGGDCIVAPDGSFRIVDFNDWPSYGSCVESAAEAIGDYLENYG